MGNRCPVCKQAELGRVGQNQFYCPECCLEMNMTAEQITLFSIADDGSLVEYDQYTE